MAVVGSKTLAVVGEPGADLLILCDGEDEIAIFVVLNLGERTLVPGKKNGPHDFGFGGQALGGVDESRFGAADYMARAFAMKFWRLCAFWTFWWGKKSVPRLPAKIVAQG